jgi:hypothetical protein
MATDIVSVCRTVSIIKDYSETERTGANGDFTQKQVIFKVASGREYKQNIVGKDGKVTKGYETDFWLVKAVGNTATSFWENCGQFKTAEGKHKSRLIKIVGRLESYSKPRNVTLNANIGGQMYEVKGAVEETNLPILIADRIQFLDANPNRQQTAADVPVVATPVATPVEGAQVAATQSTQPVQTVQSQAQQVMPSASAIAAAVQQVVQEGFMNAPVAAVADDDSDPF